MKNRGWGGVLAKIGFFLAAVSVAAFTAVGLGRAQWNMPPSIYGVTPSNTSGSGDITSTGFTPNPSGTKNLYVRGTVSDPDGCTDISSVYVRVFRTGVMSSCVPNDSNCYNVWAYSFSGCTGPGDYDADFEVVVPIASYAEPTDSGSMYEWDNWSAMADVYDSFWNFSRQTVFFEMNSQPTSQAPSIDSITATTGTYLGAPISDFTPNEGTTETIYAHGVLSDPDGCSDVDSVEVTFYRSGVGSGCSANDNNCYKVSAASTTFIGCTELTAIYQVSADIKNYADPTDAGSPYETETWYAAATATDMGLLTGTNISQAVTMNSLLAVDSYPGTLDYGTVNLGAVSAEVELTVSNTGNRQVGVLMRADGDMVSDAPGAADISVSNAHYSTLQGFEWVDGFLIGLEDTSLGVSLPQQTTETVPTGQAYFRIKMPDSGARGIYRNVLILTASSTAY